MSSANQRRRTNTTPETVNKTHGHVVFENNSEAIWGCVHRTVNSKSPGVVYFACLSGRSYLSPGERTAEFLAKKFLTKEAGKQNVKFNLPSFTSAIYITSSHQMTSL